MREFHAARSTGTAEAALSSTALPRSRLRPQEGARCAESECSWLLWVVSRWTFQLVHSLCAVGDMPWRRECYLRVPIPMSLHGAQDGKRCISELWVVGGQHRPVGGNTDWQLRLASRATVLPAHRGWRFASNLVMHGTASRRHGECGRRPPSTVGLCCGSANSGWLDGLLELTQ